MESIFKVNWFPAEYARTLNYTLGAPRTFRVSRNGRRIFFLRSKSATDRTLDLWYIDLADDSGAEEALLADFDSLNKDSGSIREEPEAAKIRRERLREAANGITSYSIDDKGAIVAFAAAGDVYLLHLGNSKSPLVRQVGDATDVRIAPNGESVSFVTGRELFIAKVSDSEIGLPVRVSPPAREAISWGLPEFIAAEEMHRHEGYWWSPDSKSIVFTGVDEAPIPTWYVPNPADPMKSPRIVRYPRAGGPNACVSLHLWSEQLGQRELEWSKEEFPYLVALKWKGNEPTLVVQDRRQRRVAVLAHSGVGSGTCLYEKEDDLWVELIAGVPDWSRQGGVVDSPDTEIRTLEVDGKVVSKPGLQVRKYVGQTASGGYVYLGSHDPKETHVWLACGDGEHICLSEPEGVFDAEVGGDTIVVFGSKLSDTPLSASIIDLQRSATRTKVKSKPKTVSIKPRPQFFQARVRDIHYSVLFPSGFRGERPLPALMDPYGGPWGQRCVRSTLSYTISQWFADQGFAVIVADGRGTPGRGRSWERAIAGNLIQPVLEDQVAVLDDALSRQLPVNGDKVGIRGWSFGGYLAALAILLRPDRFHAGIAGAPVTDWRYYDTHYTERYLGDPVENAEAYDRCSAIAVASRLRRPLLLIHGLSDDNVFAAHTLRLSDALFKAGKAHNVLPLSGSSHMTASAPAAENLLIAQLLFLRHTLGVDVLETV